MADVLTVDVAEVAEPPQDDQKKRKTRQPKMQVEKPAVESSPPRTFAKRGKALETELAIRKDERDKWVAVLSKLGDGRANRGTPKEVRSAYRQVAAMLDQDRMD